MGAWRRKGCSNCHWALWTLKPQAAKALLAEFRVDAVRTIGSASLAFLFSTKLVKGKLQLARESFNSDAPRSH